MEIVWQNEFKCLFDNYEPNVWALLPISQKPQGHWNTYVDSAKVRFCCEVSYQNEMIYFTYLPNSIVVANLPKLDEVSQGPLNCSLSKGRAQKGDLCRYLYL
ncbi:hypothetical protein TNCV_2419261 [Trichonephila clavipes]|nr:hypothetical protein TNCV_2419261 [Trichonephila clavipes]